MALRNLFLKFSVISIMLMSPLAMATGNDSFETAAQELQQRLGKVLMSTIQRDGHIAAIQVCNEKAPEIADAVSEEEGLTVSRTALKVRNPENAPTPEQERVLNDFKRLWSNNKNNPLTDVYNDRDGNKVWMRAIAMQPQCSACHGSSVEPELKQAIIKRYPNDEATGFEVGDIRGAFVISKKNPSN